MKITLNVDTSSMSEIREAIHFLEGLIGETPSANEVMPVQTITQAASQQAHEDVYPQNTQVTDTQQASDGSAAQLLEEVKKEEPKPEPLPKPHVINEEF